MPLVICIQQDGSEIRLEVEVGTSVMAGAVAADVPGIIGECGGGAMCGTCHVYVEAAQLASFPPMEEDEDELLAAASAPRREESRLSCQLVLGPGHEKVTVQVPESQGLV